jgi:hypothetical protein
MFFSVLSTMALEAGARWMFWSKDVGPEVEDLLFFSRLRWWDAVDFAPRWYGDVPGQHVTTTCALLLATGMFI